jgi:hypothetical protein
VSAEFVGAAEPSSSARKKILYFFFHINIKSLGWDYWYLPDSGAGYSDISLISVDDPRDPGWQPPEMNGRLHRPHSDQTYFELDKDLRFRDTLPYPPDAPAPYYIFVPNFGEDVWYDGRTIVSGNRYMVPRAFFVLDHCRKAS